MKQRIAVIVSCILMLGAITSVALADLVEWANTPWPGTKWFQPPELTEPYGVDTPSNVDRHDDNPLIVVMDDWQCTSTEPVKGFRWWGSYFLAATGGMYTIDNLLGFYIAIHSDIPANGDFSHPGERLRLEYFTIDQLGYGEVGHQLPIAVGPDGKMVYEYFALFNEGCFWQQGTPTNPVIYWVGIVADVKSDTNSNIDGAVWGWHASNTQNLDDAVMIYDYDQNGEYSEFMPVEDEQSGRSLDMAFEVIPEPTALMLMAPGVLGLVALIRRRK